ncbi:MAG: DnaJ domain-containing protein [Crocinitomicaceae bacterium]
MIPEKYYRTLGLNSGASLDEIKKSYRRLAKIHHPDRSKDPNSAEIFIQITEAYDILTGQSNYTQSKPFNPERKKKNDVEERVKKARERFEKKREKEAEENEKYYKNITKGKKFKKYRLVALCSAILSLLMIVDVIIPGKTIREEVTGINLKTSNHGLHYDEITTISLNGEAENIWVDIDFAYALIQQKEVVVERTFLFHDIKMIYAPYGNQWAFSKADYSLAGIFPTVPILLFCPFIILLFKSRTILYSFLFNVSYYAFMLLVTMILLSNFRWLHLITLGFW